MIAHHRENHPFPTVVEIKSDDSLEIKRVKRIILNMTKFKPLDRKSIAEVEQEMGGIYSFNCMNNDIFQFNEVISSLT